MKGTPGYLKRLADWIEEHGHYAYVTFDCVTFATPWQNPTTGEEGFDVHHVHTFREAREVMGY